jgi:hypothetical protein
LKDLGEWYPERAIELEWDKDIRAYINQKLVKINHYDQAKYLEYMYVINDQNGQAEIYENDLEFMRGKDLT